MKKITSLVGVALLAACASESPTEGIGRAESALMPACGAKLADVDGVWAYSNGWATNTGDSCWGQTDVGAYAFQCVELAQRYMNAKFGIAALWPVAYAAQMCASHPAGVTTHWASNGYRPKHGDLVVFDTGRWGHVAVVRTVIGNVTEIVEQNASIGGSQGVRRIPVWAGGVSCYVSADANTRGADTGDASTGGACAFGDGDYCGGNGGGDDRGVLYRCSGGVATPIETCTLGCEWRPDLENDRCRTDAACPSGEGLYCGGNGVSGASNVLFECTASRITAAARCPHGCEPMDAMVNDRCR